MGQLSSNGQQLSLVCAEKAWKQGNEGDWNTLPLICNCSIIAWISYILTNFKCNLRFDIGEFIVFSLHSNGLKSKIYLMQFKNLRISEFPWEFVINFEGFHIWLWFLQCYKHLKQFTYFVQCIQITNDHYKCTIQQHSKNLHLCLHNTSCLYEIPAWNQYTAKKCSMNKICKNKNRLNEFYIGFQ